MPFIARHGHPGFVVEKSSPHGCVLRLELEIGPNAAAPHLPQFVGLCAVFPESAVGYTTVNKAAFPAAEARRYKATKKTPKNTP